MEKIFFTTHKGLFSNSYFIGARKLTKDDFTIKLEYDSIPETKEDFKYRSDFYRLTVTLVLKDEVVQELNDFGYFRRYGERDINKMNDRIKEGCITSIDSVGQKIDYKTGKGGKVTSLTKKIERVKEAHKKLMERLEGDVLARKIQEWIDNDFNQYIQNKVEEKNERLASETRSALTSRTKLVELVELNEDSLDGDEVSAVEDFRKNTEAIDESIEALQQKINALEQAKTEQYIKLSASFFKDGKEDLPEELKKEISEADAYGVVKPFRLRTSRNNS